MQDKMFQYEECVLKRLEFKARDKHLAFQILNVQKLHCKKVDLNLGSMREELEIE